MVQQKRKEMSGHRAFYWPHPALGALSQASSLHALGTCPHTSTGPLWQVKKLRLEWVIQQVNGRVGVEPRLFDAKEDAFLFFNTHPRTCTLILEREGGW